ncbi:mediator of DNA damage checkpoint protein 1-like [Saccostrea cucullata]|uniref:mediator of DNA damage checkpoint protein 1-like n=1 Tax=Saccostrea cuccullata TaxID=36930 RepID=UPI002ED0941C
MPLLLSGNLVQCRSTQPAASQPATDEEEGAHCPALIPKAVKQRRGGCAASSRAQPSPSQPSPGSSAAHSSQPISPGDPVPRPGSLTEKHSDVVQRRSTQPAASQPASQPQMKSPLPSFDPKSSQAEKRRVRSKQQSPAQPFAAQPWIQRSPLQPAHLTRRSSAATRQPNREALGRGTTQEHPASRQPTSQPATDEEEGAHCPALIPKAVKQRRGGCAASSRAQPSPSQPSPGSSAAHSSQPISPGDPALGRGTTQEHPASRQPTSQPATDEEEGAHCPALIPKAVKQRRGGKIHSGAQQAAEPSQALRSPALDRSAAHSSQPISPGDPALGRGTTQEHPASRQPTSQPATDEEEGAHCPALIPKAVKQRRGGCAASSRAQPSPSQPSPGSSAAHSSQPISPGDPALGRGTTQEHPASRQPTSQPATDEEEGAHCPALIPKAVKQRRGGCAASSRAQPSPSQPSPGSSAAHSSQPISPGDPALGRGTTQEHPASRQPTSQPATDEEEGAHCPALIPKAVKQRRGGCAASSRAQPSPSQPSPGSSAAHSSQPISPGDPALGRGTTQEHPASRQPTSQPATDEEEGAHCPALIPKAVKQRRGGCAAAAEPRAQPSPGSSAAHSSQLISPEDPALGRGTTQEHPASRQPTSQPATDEEEGAHCPALIPKAVKQRRGGCAASSRAQPSPSQPSPGSSAAHSSQPISPGDPALGRGTTQEHPASRQPTSQPATDEEEGAHCPALIPKAVKQRRGGCAASSRAQPSPSQPSPGSSAAHSSQPISPGDPALGRGTTQEHPASRQPTSQPATDEEEGAHCPALIPKAVKQRRGGCAASSRAQPSPSQPSPGSSAAHSSQPISPGDPALGRGTTQEHPASRQPTSQPATDEEEGAHCPALIPKAVKQRRGGCAASSRAQPSPSQPSPGSSAAHSSQPISPGDPALGRGTTQEHPASRQPTSQPATDEEEGAHCPALIPKAVKQRRGGCAASSRAQPSPSQPSPGSSAAHSSQPISPGDPALGRGTTQEHPASRQPTSQPATDEEEGAHCPALIPKAVKQRRGGCAASSRAQPSPSQPSPGSSAAHSSQPISPGDPALGRGTTQEHPASRQPTSQPATDEEEGAHCPALIPKAVKQRRGGCAASSRAQPSPSQPSPGSSAAHSSQLISPGDPALGRGTTQEHPASRQPTSQPATDEEEGAHCPALIPKAVKQRRGGCAASSRAQPSPSQPSPGSSAAHSSQPISPGDPALGRGTTQEHPASRQPTSQPATDEEEGAHCPALIPKAVKQRRGGCAASSRAQPSPSQPSPGSSAAHSSQPISPGDPALGRGTTQEHPASRQPTSQPATDEEEGAHCPALIPKAVKQRRGGCAASSRAQPSPGSSAAHSSQLISPEDPALGRGTTQEHPASRQPTSQPATDEEEGAHCPALIPKAVKQRRGGCAASSRAQPSPSQPSPGSSAAHSSQLISPGDPALGRGTTQEHPASRQPTSQPATDEEEGAHCPALIPKAVKQRRGGCAASSRAQPSPSQPSPGSSAAHSSQPISPGDPVPRPGTRTWYNAGAPSQPPANQPTSQPATDEEEGAHCPALIPKAVKQRRGGCAASSRAQPSPSQPSPGSSAAHSSQPISPGDPALGRGTTQEHPASRQPTSQPATDEEEGAHCPALIPKAVKQRRGGCAASSRAQPSPSQPSPGSSAAHSSQPISPGDPALGRGTTQEHPASRQPTSQPATDEEEGAHCPALIPKAVKQRRGGCAASSRAQPSPSQPSPGSSAAHSSQPISPGDPALGRGTTQEHPASRQPTSQPATDEEEGAHCPALIPKAVKQRRGGCAASSRAQPSPSQPSPGSSAAHSSQLISPGDPALGRGTTQEHPASRQPTSQPATDEEEGAHCPALIPKAVKQRRGGCAASSRAQPSPSQPSPGSSAAHSSQPISPGDPALGRGTTQEHPASRQPTSQPATDEEEGAHCPALIPKAVKQRRGGCAASSRAQPSPSAAQPWIQRSPLQPAHLTRRSSAATRQPNREALGRGTTQEHPASRQPTSQPATDEEEGAHCPALIPKAVKQRRGGCAASSRAQPSPSQPSPGSSAAHSSQPTPASPSHQEIQCRDQALGRGTTQEHPASRQPTSQPATDEEEGAHCPALIPKAVKQRRGGCAASSRAQPSPSQPSPGSSAAHSSQPISPGDPALGRGTTQEHPASRQPTSQPATDEEEGAHCPALIPKAVKQRRGGCAASSRAQPSPSQPSPGSSAAHSSQPISPGDPALGRGTTQEHPASRQPTSQPATDEEEGAHCPALIPKAVKQRRGGCAASSRAQPSPSQPSPGSSAAHSSQPISPGDPALGRGTTQEHPASRQPTSQPATDEEEGAHCPALIPKAVKQRRGGCAASSRAQPSPSQPSPGSSAAHSSQPISPGDPALGRGTTQEHPASRQPTSQPATDEEEGAHCPALIPKAVKQRRGGCAASSRAQPSPSQPSPGSSAAHSSQLISPGDPALGRGTTQEHPASRQPTSQPATDEEEGAHCPALIPKAVKQRRGGCAASSRAQPSPSQPSPGSSAAHSSQLISPGDPALGRGTTQEHPASRQPTSQPATDEEEGAHCPALISKAVKHSDVVQCRSTQPAASQPASQPQMKRKELFAKFCLAAYICQGGELWAAFERRPIEMFSSILGNKDRLQPHSMKG